MGFVSQPCDCSIGMTEDNSRRSFSERRSEDAKDVDDWLAGGGQIFAGLAVLAIIVFGVVRMIWG